MEKTWRNGTFKNSLRHEQPLLSFIEYPLNINSN